MLWMVVVYYVLYIVVINLLQQYAVLVLAIFCCFYDVYSENFALKCYSEVTSILHTAPWMIISPMGKRNGLKLVNNAAATWLQWSSFIGDWLNSRPVKLNAVVFSSRSMLVFYVSPEVHHFLPCALSLSVVCTYARFCVGIDLIMFTCRVQSIT